MIRLIELSCGSTTTLLAGTLSRSSGGSVSITTASGSSRLEDPELGDPDELFVASLPRGLIALGEESHSLLAWREGDSSLKVLGSVARLDLDGYDPGGLRRVRMLAVNDDEVLVETEVGFTLVGLSDGIVWSHCHDDLTTRIDRISHGVLVVRSESADSRLSMADGSYLHSEPHD